MKKVYWKNQAFAGQSAGLAAAGRPVPPAPGRASGSFRLNGCMLGKRLEKAGDPAGFQPSPGVKGGGTGFFSCL